MVLATGGKQRLPSDLEALGIEANDPKFFVSDQIMMKEGFMRFKKYVVENQVEEVDIVGGSHSGFSVAWMMLNGSAMFDFKPS